MAEKNGKKAESQKAEKEKTEKKGTTVQINRRLYRSETNKLIAGVSGGLGEYFNVDPVIIRLLFVLFTLIHGSGVLLYLILWVVLPKESKVEIIAQNPGETFHENLTDAKDEIRSIAQHVRIRSGNYRGSWIGAILVIFGLLILMDNLGFPVWLGFDKLWPILLIILGFAFLTR